MNAPPKKNLHRQRMSQKGREAFLVRFREDAARALRGGITEEDLVATVHEAVVAEIQET